MSGFRLSSEAEVQLDNIWLRIARESGNVDAASRIIDDITDRFWLLARHPYIGRGREDLGPGLRSFPAGDYIIIHRVESDEMVLILYVFHGNQDIESFFAIKQ